SWTFRARRDFPRPRWPTAWRRLPDMKDRGGRRRRWTPRSQGSGSVNLISMMDILTVLLLFLLKSYVSGEVMVPPPGVRLPNSTADQSPQSSLVVAIDDNQILIGGGPV